MRSQGAVFVAVLLLTARDVQLQHTRVRRKAQKPINHSHKLCNDCVDRVERDHERDPGLWRIFFEDPELTLDRAGRGDGAFVWQGRFTLSLCVPNLMRALAPSAVVDQHRSARAQTQKAAHNRRARMGQQLCEWDNTSRMHACLVAFNQTGRNVCLECAGLPRPATLLKYALNAF